MFKQLNKKEMNLLKGGIIIDVDVADDDIIIEFDDSVDDIIIDLDDADDDKVRRQSSSSHFARYAKLGS